MIHTPVATVLSMTVAVLEKDYRVWDNGKLNFDATIKNLKAMEKILNEAIDSSRP